MMNAQRLSKFSITLLLGAGAFILLTGGDDALSSPTFSQSKRVRVAAVRSQNLQRKLTFSGTLRASDRANLTFTMPGRMTERLVKIGDTVSHDQVIARLDQVPLRNARDAAAALVREVEARRQQALRDVARVEGLVTVKAATQEELEQTRAGLEVLAASVSSAKTALEEADRQLRETVIKAPYGGTITEVFLEAGEFASFGTPVVQVTGNRNLELEIEVPESILAQCAVGQEVTLTLPFSNNRILTGRIRSVTPSSGSPGRLFPVVVSVSPADHLYAGMTARLELILPQPNSLLVPVSAVLNPGGAQPVVFRLVGNRVELVDVEVGVLIDDWVAVRGLLSPSDQVATSGFYGLLSGDEVEVMK